MKAFLLSASSVVALIACTNTAPNDLAKQPARVQTAKPCTTPKATKTCVCGIDTGTQTCTEELVLSKCVCDVKPGAPTPPVTKAQPDAPIDVTVPPSSAVCGNSVIEPGEACDYGKDGALFGCTEKCTAEGFSRLGDECEGQKIGIWAGVTVLKDSTTKYNSDYILSCSDNEDGGPERVYRFSPAQSGNLTVAVEASGFNSVVQLTEGTCLSASLKCLKNGLKTDTVPVVAGKSYFLFVGGVTVTDFGDYSVSLTLVPGK